MEKIPGKELELRELQPHEDDVMFWATFTLRQMVKNGHCKPDEVWKYQEKLEQ